MILGNLEKHLLTGVLQVGRDRDDKSERGLWKGRQLLKIVLVNKYMMP